MSDRQPIAVGIDGAIVKAGWAYGTLGGRIIAAGSVYQSTRGMLQIVIHELFNQLAVSYDAQRSVVGIERGFLGKNAAMHQELAEVRGELKAWAESYGFRVELVHSAIWRRSIGVPSFAAKRKELKFDSIAKAQLLAPGVAIPNDDVADAVCICTHVAAMETRRLQIAAADRRRA